MGNRTELGKEGILMILKVCLWAETPPSNSLDFRFLPANRETAFVHAISSAGVMYTLTRNCSLGDFDNCGCDDSRNGQLGE